MLKGSGIPAAQNRPAPYLTLCKVSFLQGGHNIFQRQKWYKAKPLPFDLILPSSFLFFRQRNRNDDQLQQRKGNEGNLPHQKKKKKKGFSPVCNSNHTTCPQFSGVIHPKFILKFESFSLSRTIFNSQFTKGRNLTTDELPPMNQGLCWLKEFIHGLTANNRWHTKPNLGFSDPRWIVISKSDFST